MRVSITAGIGLFAAAVFAHGEHGVPEVPADADWATRHMAEEHHITSFDAGTFFALHDYDSTGKWSPDDVRKTYGLLDESAATVPQSKKDEVVKIVFQLFDKDDSGDISKEEYTEATSNGVKLPDFGTGPGHHGDDEYEYEIHHFEKYHGGDDVKEEDLIHPEDIAHFAKHDRLDEEAEKLEAQERLSIVEYLRRVSSRPLYDILFATEQRMWDEACLVLVLAVAAIFAWSILLTGILEWPRFNGLVLREAVGHIFEAQAHAQRETLQERNQRRAQAIPDWLGMRFLDIDPLQDINHRWTSYPLTQSVLGWSLLIFIPTISIIQAFHG